MNNGSLIRAESLGKTFRSGSRELVVFHDLWLDVCPGERLAIIGASGAGKSTLLHLLGGLDRPSNGTIYFGHQDISRLSDESLSDFRNRQLGFLWQNPSLLPEFSALENVMMPLLIRGDASELAASNARARLDEVGLKTRESHRAGELSGGEQQRVAIARAVVNKPAIMLADEPTGNLDSQNSEIVLNMLRQSNRELGQTVLMITHNPAAASYGDRIIHMRDGEIVVPEKDPQWVAAR